MNLPPTLLQRLASRGLVTAKNDQKPLPEAVEEIIAESYDEYDKSLQSQLSDHSISSNSKYTVTDEHLWPDKIKERLGVIESQGFKYCPNTYNIWHTCTLYCVNKWSNVRRKPSEKYLRRYKRLLRKYPLGTEWRDIFDSGCGFYYFYNSETKKVSWLPPNHPNARITISAACIRKQIVNGNDEFNLETTDLSSNQNKNLTQVAEPLEKVKTTRNIISNAPKTK